MHDQNVSRVTGLTRFVRTSRPCALPEAAMASRDAESCLTTAGLSTSVSLAMTLEGLFLRAP